MSSTTIVNLPELRPLPNKETTLESPRSASGPSIGSAAESGSFQQTAQVQSVRDRVADLNRIEALQKNRIEFSVHEGTGRLVVRVMDRETDEILRQFPPDELLAVAERLAQEQPGSLSDSTV